MARQSLNPRNGTFIALLRAVNVGGRNAVSMADLREIAARLGLTDVRSLLQSGNLVFRSSRGKPADLEQLLQAEVEKATGLKTEFFVRSAGEWQALVDANPFRREAQRDPGRLVIVLLDKDAEGEKVRALQEWISGRETVRAGARSLYIFYPDGQGRSRLTNAVIEKKLGVRGTARNWNTVLKLRDESA